MVVVVILKQLYYYLYNVNNNDNIVSLTSHHVDSYNTTCYLYYCYSNSIVEVVDIVVVDEDINRVN